MNRQDINRLKNHVKAQGLRFFVLNKEKPRYGLISDGKTVVYWQFNSFNMGFDFSIKVTPTKETGSGWALNEEPINNLAGVDFKKMLEKKIPYWMHKHLKTVTPHFLTLKEYFSLPLHSESDYIEE